jgi:hypothetical protein
MKVEAMFIEGAHDLPRPNITFGWGLKVEAHIGHRLRAVRADNLARDMLKFLPAIERWFVNFFPLPMLESLTAIEAGEMIPVVVPSVSTHGNSCLSPSFVVPLPRLRQRAPCREA